MTINETTEEYLARWCKKVESGCWEWQGACQKNGYAVASMNRKTFRAHRVMFELKHGPLAPGVHVCHSCDNRKCINPDHLWSGNPGENMFDMSEKGRSNNQQKTHCPRGHLYADNQRLAWYPRGPNGEMRRSRYCSACSRVRYRERQGWPAHLLEAPSGEAGFSVAKPHVPKAECKHGHKIEGDNLYIDPDGYRRCRACRLATAYRGLAKAAAKRLEA